MVRVKHFGTPKDPYLDRTVLLSTPWFGVYLHHIWREDRDDYPHDHPWPFVTFILRGGYDEEWFPLPSKARGGSMRHWKRGSWHWVPLTAAHRIATVRPGTTTLIIRGRRRRDRWSFWVPITASGAVPITWDVWLGVGGKVDVP